MRLSASDRAHISPRLGMDHPVRTTLRATAVVVALLVAAGVTVAAVHHGHAAPPPGRASDAATSGFGTPSRGPAPTKLQDEIVTSLESTSWTRINPPLASLAHDGAPQWTKDGCLDVSQANAAHCVFGSGTHVAALVGDSTAISWLPGLLRAMPGWTIHVLTYDECPFGDLDTYDPTAAKRTTLYTACTQHHAWVQSTLQALHPAMVIASDGWDAYRNGRIADTTHGPGVIWQTASETSLAAFGKVAPDVVVLAPNPLLPGAQACERHGVTPGNCALGPSSGRTLTMGSEAKAAATAGARYVDTTSWFCVEDDCPAIIHRIPVTWDRAHLSAAYSRFLAPQLRAALLPSTAAKPTAGATH